MKDTEMRGKLCIASKIIEIIVITIDLASFVNSSK